MPAKIFPAKKLKAGSETGSLVNYVYSSGNVMPEVGMGATLLMWSDRMPYTIHKVEGKKIWASPDNYKRIDDNGPYTESQDYEYSNPNENKPEKWEIFRLRKNGRWVKVGQSLKSTPLHIGKREAYIDPSF